MMDATAAELVRTVERVCVCVKWEKKEIYRIKKFVNKFSERQRTKSMMLFFSIVK